MTNWTEAIFSEKPDSIFYIGPKLLMQVRNIEYDSLTNIYRCETRELTESELILENETNLLRLELAVSNNRRINDI